MSSGAPAGTWAAVATCCALTLSGCADKEPEPVETSPPTTSAATVPPTSRSSPSASTATPLPGMPAPVSDGGSPVDSSKLRSLDDLPTVFDCPTAVTPIRLPATASTAATGPPAPDAVVCASALADNEALYLWYAPTPEAKLGALTEALTRLKYVHAGPNWVAGGMVKPTMGTVGGEVYR